MQTYLPHHDFQQTAKALDNKRLNNQILEATQILKTLSTKQKAWSQHPAVLMWKNHETTLAHYTQTLINEANTRGIKTDKNQQNLNNLTQQYQTQWSTTPPTWNTEQINRLTTTHQANLYKKDPNHYHQYQQATTHPNNKPCCTRCNYYWIAHAK